MSAIPPSSSSSQQFVPRLSSRTGTAREVDGMGSVAVQHHVYSSAGGYRTLFAHPAAKPHVPALEDWARRQCSAAHAQTLWASVPLGTTHWVISKTFSAGVDRAGRPRKCVHSILLARPRLAEEWPSFNPARLPVSWFLGKRSRLDDANLAAQLATSLPALTPDRTGSSANPVQTERDLSLARVLMHAERGIIHGHPESTESIAALLDWLPLPYRLRWSVTTDLIGGHDHERQIVLGHTVPPNASLPTLAHGHPLHVEGTNPGMNGVWDLWLTNLNGTSSKTFESFRAWFDRLALHAAPGAAEEHWLLAAFQCLAPFEPAVDVAPKLQSAHMPQIALGILALGWADQPGAAMERLAEYGDALIAAGNVPALASLLSAASSATAPLVDSIPGGEPMAHHDGASALASRARLEHEEALYAPHALVAQTVMRLMLNTPRVSLTPATAVDVPTPDVRACAAPWLGDRRSLLWANVFVLLRDLLASVADGTAGAGGQTDEANHGVWVQLAGVLATLRRYENAFGRDHQWVLSEMAAPRGATADLRAILERLRDTSERGGNDDARDIARALDQLAATA